MNIFCKWMRSSVFLMIVTIIFAFSSTSYSFFGRLKRVFFVQKTETSFLASVNAIEQQLQQSEKEKTQLQASWEEVKKSLEKTGAQLGALKNRIERGGADTPFLQKKLSLVSQSHQVLLDLDHLYQQVIDEVEQYIKLLEGYKADSSFAHLMGTQKAVESFDDFQKLAQRIVEYRSRLAEYEKNKIQVGADVSQRKKALAIISDEYKEKKRQQEEFSGSMRSLAVRTAAIRISDEYGELTIEQQGALVDEQEHLLHYKYELAQLKVKEAEFKIHLLDLQIALEREQLHILRKEYTRVKRTVRVDKNYVKQSREKLEESRQASVTMTDRLQDKIKILSLEKEDFKKKLDELVSHAQLSSGDLAAIREGTYKPETVAQWAALTQVTYIFAHESFIDAEREYLEGLIDLEKSIFKNKQIEFNTVESWYKMTQRSFRVETENEIDQEIKSYDVPKAELQADYIVFNDKRNRAISLLHSLNSSLDRVKELGRQLRAEKSILFKNMQPEYASVLKQAFVAEEQIRSRIDRMAKLIEIYSTIIVNVNESIKKIDGVIAELNAKSFWRRSNYSIDLQELQEFVPDIRHFIREVYRATIQHVAQFSIPAVGNAAWQVIKHPLQLFLLVINLLILLLIFYILRLYVPYVRRYLEHIGPQYRLLNKFAQFFILVCLFIQEHIKGLYIWIVALVLANMGMVTDAYYVLMLYLISIPYLIYLTYRFIHHFMAVNNRRNHMFISPSYEKRFLMIVPSVIYATIGLLFFREAFMMSSAHASYVPTILLALVFILLQIALISLLGKEQILGMLHNDTPLGEWIYDHVNRYYNVILAALIAIIIMVNPYVGYGRQVLYVLSRVGLTVILIPVLLWVHNALRKMSADLFFYYSDGEVVKERFSAGRTWYGFFVVASFIFLVFVGILIAAHLWSRSLSIRDISEWFTYELYSPGADEFGKRISVTILSLVQVLIYLLCGMALTYIVSHYVLRRFFDPLLVGVGVQNTILTLTRYIIIIFAVLLGMSSAGLDGMTTKFAILIAAIGYIVQEPFRDFFSYFIILVQRPIKIGDYIMVDRDPDLVGVVRHITPRSIVLRKKNSVTIMVPNSDFLIKPIINWNYTRNFFAFDDIKITVPYDTDPAYVKSLILGVLERNSNVLKSPAPIVRLEDFVDNGYQFLVRGYLTADKVLEQWEIASELRIELVKILHQEGLQVASPTRVLKVVRKSDIIDGEEGSEG